MTTKQRKVAKLHPYKERKVAVGQRVKVYRNLRNKMFSIADAATGEVLAHSRTVLLKDVTFIVSEAGRQRVLREKQKNVHAFVVGTFIGTAQSKQEAEAYYNPYKTATFLDAEGEPLHRARCVALQDTRIFYSGKLA